MSKKNIFKVGDKVKVREWDEMEKQYGLDRDGDIKARPCFATGMRRYCGKVLTVSSVCNSGSIRLAEAPVWYFDPDTIRLVKKGKTTQKIVITTDGIDTLARLYEDGKVVRSAQAKCAPDDEFDFETGAKLAFDRLMLRDEQKEETATHLECGGRYYGTLGTPTKYVDKSGTALCVGDIVDLSYNGKCVATVATTVVVETKDEGQFVMGIECDCDEETGETVGWQLVKSRSYKDVACGEVFTHVEFVK